MKDRESYLEEMHPKMYDLDLLNPKMFVLYLIVCR